MKTKLIFLLWVFVSSCVYSQDISNKDFGKFKSFFESTFLQPSQDCQKIEVPVELSRKLLGESIIDNNVVSIFAIESIDVKNGSVFIIEAMYPEGGYSSSLLAILFSKNENVVETKVVGSNMIDYEGGVRCDVDIVNDSLIEVIKKTVELNDLDEEIVSKMDYSYLRIKERSISLIELIKPSKGREYPETTVRILGLSELMKMDKSSLDIMRNEIFASHGYIFKTEKWKEYFTDKIWYIPKYYDVNDKLSIIEKINVKNILKASH
ncbi:YARHG domain-containing protein [Labilibaculum euxinus]